MGSNLNFKNFNGDDSGNNGTRPPGNFPLTRQPSVYSLTFDEFQSTMGGIGKDFGSMNMDELLKNIWSAEEAHSNMVSSSTFQEGLQRQGSLTLPRTLSQKTVDEVWKDISKEYVHANGNGNGNVAATANGGGGGGGAGGGGISAMPQRQQTLGEITLEEFLVRAGVVREDVQLAAAAAAAGKVNANGGGIFNNNNGTNQISLQSSNLPLNVNGVRSNQAAHAHQQQQQSQHLQPQQQQQQHLRHQPQQIFPKQPNLGYVTQMPLQTSPGIRGGIMGIDQGIGGGLMQGGGMGMVGLGGVATGSPANQLSSDGITKSNGDTFSVSPVPYTFNGGLRGRRPNSAVEKVVERRQRRMIKNRESAARSRARKQAYTMELEAEVAKLKEENQELRRKQEEMVEMQKNQVLEMMKQQQAKRRCLRRTQTGPW